MKSRGGQLHFPSLIALPNNTGENVPQLAAFPIVHGGHWLDLQNVSGEDPMWEGRMDATVITHMVCWIDMWRTTAASASVILKLPMIVGLAVCDLFDPLETGDPNDFAPTVLPNCFSRNFGHRSAAAAETISPDTTLAESAFSDTCRIIWRQPVLLAAGALDDASHAFRSVTHTHRKRILIRRHQGLCLFFNGYNSHLEDPHGVGFRFHTTFGYRHFKRD